MPIKYNGGHQTKDDKTNGTYATNGGKEKFIQGLMEKGCQENLTLGRTVILLLLLL
jgi:hypothetical protein